MRDMLNITPDKKQLSIKFLQDNEPEDGFYLGFSGGKDSIVTKHLLILSGVKFISGYSFLGIDPPEVVKYIRQHHSDVKIITSPSFFKNVIKRGPPLIFKRWCCDTQKKLTQKDDIHKHVILGIRAEESPKRKKRGEIIEFRDKIIYHPIFHWKEWEVWEFIEKHNLPYCELYDDPNIYRIGCCICPFMNEKERLYSIKKYPGYWKAYKKSLFTFYINIADKKSKEKAEDFYTHYPTFEEFWEWIGIKGEWKPHAQLKNKLGIEL